jgi:hypothetical protein
MFHLKEGWFFERLSDGSVMVTKRKDAGMESPIITRMIVPPEEWASVVASVSAGNEFNGRWKAALDFHSGLTPRAADGAYCECEDRNAWSTEVAGLCIHCEKPRR